MLMGIEILLSNMMRPGGHFPSSLPPVWLAPKQKPADRSGAQAVDRERRRGQARQGKLLRQAKGSTRIKETTLNAMLRGFQYFLAEGNRK